MYELDKEAVGSFIAERRKMTQKDLAERLFVSDKAVSKWERGLSFPDVSLLIPLADIFEVSVTELLEGKMDEKATDQGSGKAAGIVESIRDFGAEDDKKTKQRKAGRIFAFLLITIGMGMELFFMASLLKQEKYQQYGEIAWHIFDYLTVTYFLAFYTMCVMRDRLPTEYDEEKKTVYLDPDFMGFRLELLGLRFHNGNWPKVVGYLRAFCMISTLLLPAIWILMILTCMNVWGMAAMILGGIVPFLACLFVPTYVVGRKYE